MAFSAKGRAEASNADNIVVLVPGFFNSMAPGGSLSLVKHPYFSDDIVEVFEKRSYKVYVVDNLSPVGTISQNAGLLKSYLKSLESREPGKGMILVGHSAGGIYSLQASSDDWTLPIREISTIGTPFDGLHFIENLEGMSIPTDLILKFMDLTSLCEFTAKKMEVLLPQLHMSPRIRLKVHYGYQLPSKMTFPMRLANKIGGAPSDGIVTINSAKDVESLQTTGLQDVSVEQNDYIHLEHWQQVLDYRIFSVFNVDLEAIRAEQIRYYNKIADTL